MAAKRALMALPGVLREVQIKQHERAHGSSVAHDLCRRQHLRCNRHRGAGMGCSHNRPAPRWSGSRNDSPPADLAGTRAGGELGNRTGLPATNGKLAYAKDYVRTTCSPLSEDFPAAEPSRFSDLSRFALGRVHASSTTCALNPHVSDRVLQPFPPPMPR